MREWARARLEPPPRRARTAQGAKAPRRAAAPTRLGGGRKGVYATGAYWQERTDLLYYQYFRFMIRCIGHEAGSMADVGSGNCGYLDWFDWIPERVSIDLKIPYRSQSVRAIRGDILALDLQRFDVVSCLQVIEHVPDPAPFARRLLELGRVVVVSVPYRWPRGTRGHVNDPVDLAKLEGWFGRRANYHLVVTEPFVGAKGARLIALFDEDPRRRFGRTTLENCRPA